MSGRTAGFLVARGLATLLGLHSVYFLMSSIQWILNQESTLPRERLSTVWPFASQSVIYLAASIVLWFGAPRFGPPDSTPAKSTMSTRAAFGIALIGISLFTIYSHLAGAVESLRMLVVDDMGRYTGTLYWPDIVAVVVAGLVIPFGWRLTLEQRVLEGGEDAEEGA